MGLHHHLSARKSKPAWRAVAATLCGVVAVLATGLPGEAVASLPDARVVFVHAAPTGPAASALAFHVDGVEPVSLAPHERSGSLAIAAGLRTIRVTLPDGFSLETERRLVADQTYLVFLAGDGSRQPYALLVDLPASVVSRRGLAVATIHDTATVPGMLPEPTTTARYDRFIACADTIARGPALFGSSADAGYMQIGDTPVPCRAGLVERGGDTVLAEIAFEGRSGRRVQVYGTGDGIGTPLAFHLVELDDAAVVAPRPMGPDMTGMWASRSTTGELLIVQPGTGGTALTAVYTGFDSDGRPAWSALRARAPRHPHEHPLEVLVPTAGDPAGRRPFAGVTADAGTLMFLSCTEAVIEFATRTTLPARQFFSTRGARIRDGVRLARLTAPNGCSDP